MRLIKDSIDRFFDRGLHLETRTLYLGDEGDGVDAYMAQKTIMALHILAAHDSEKEVRIILNSFGGCVYNGMAIFDAIKAFPSHITIEATGACMSMASIILQAADERILHPHCTVMIHDGYSGFEGHARDYEAWAKFDKKYRRKFMYEIYAKRTGKPVSYWEKRCSHDYILTAEEAVYEGLADRIAGKDEK